MILEDQLDPIDHLILNELTLDARISFVQLAKKLSVSNTLIHQRVKKMKEAGIIQNATFRIDPWKLGYETCAYTQIMLADPKRHRQVEEELEKI
ncbi:MAG: winged helix-turn-helix transcriptional regulator, partial [Bacteroidota bacterium]